MTSIDKLYFTTFFDSGYLSKGLALYQSLCRHCADFELIVFAMTEESFNDLQKLKLPNLRVIFFDSIQGPVLEKIKKERNLRSYLWTCTPYTIDYCLNILQVPKITYLDADLYFFSDPRILIDDLGNKSVSITPHFFDPEFDNSQLTGKYCVQFLTFKNNREGNAVCSDWKQKCTDWCFDFMADGKFGDQKYLDYWEQDFPGTIHVIDRLGAGLAPWNFKHVEVLAPGNDLQLFRSGVPEGKLIFAHFHGFSELSNGQFIMFGEPYLTTSSVRKQVYHAYVMALVAVEKYLEEQGVKRYTIRLLHTLTTYLLKPWIREGLFFKSLNRLIFFQQRFVNVKKEPHGRHHS